MTSAFSWQNFVSLCPASFYTPRPNLPVILGISSLLTFTFQSPMMRRTSYFGVDHLVMSMCKISCVVGRGCLLWRMHSLGKTLLAFALLHFILQGQICLLVFDLTNIPDKYQFSSVTRSCPTLCHPMNHSTTGLPLQHQLPEST